MSKCKKVKNPCKICLNSVTQKNGLQCQGACQSWVHYSCLNYTPGKIKDIKAGIIRVNCPCPDCKSSLPKEYRTDEAYSCNNTQCPANQPPKCSNALCPINYGAPEQLQNTAPCPLGQCGTSCKQYSTPQVPSKVPSAVGLPCVTKKTTQGSSDDECLQPKKCPSGCESEPGDFGNNKKIRRKPSQNMTETVHQLCDTVGMLSEQINELMCQMKHNAQAKGGNKKSNKKALCPKPCFCPDSTRKR